MHDDDVPSDARLVSQLVAEQFPHWAALPVVAVPATGTDNLVYRLGDELVVRMPRIHWAVAQVERDAAWLPRFAATLAVAVPEPVAVGEPGLGYPYPWAVHRWLPGSNPRPGDHPGLAQDLARVVVSLRRLTDGPGSSRTVLPDRDEAVRAALAAVTDEVDLATATRVWEDGLSTPPYDGVWVVRHGDLTCGNLLVDTSGRLSAVIDWGTVGLGDPAVDLVPHWRVFRGRSREVFRDAVGADEAAWVRARAWALSIAVLELSYYRDRDPVLADGAREALAQLL